jgi:hypothetical protein
MEGRMAKAKPPYAGPNWPILLCFALSGGFWAAVAAVVR